MNENRSPEEPYIVLSDMLGYSSDRNLLPLILEKRFRLAEVEFIISYLKENLHASGLVSKEKRILDKAIAEGVLVKDSKTAILRLTEVYYETVWKENISQNEKQLWFEWEIEYRNYLEKKYSNSTSFSRVIPFSESDSIASEAHETVEGVLNAVNTIALSPCGCRSRLSRCRCSIYTCLSFNSAADYFVSIGRGKYISRNEAVSICKESENEGLIHTAAVNLFEGYPGVEFICNCCQCCCIYHEMQKRTNRRIFIKPSNFRISVVSDCEQCQQCINKCPKSALRIADGQICVESDKCIGCGLCLSACPHDALALKHLDVNERFDPPVIKGHFI